MKYFEKIKGSNYQLRVRSRISEKEMNAYHKLH